jgi:hypothetical protein
LCSFTKLAGFIYSYESQLCHFAMDNSRVLPSLLVLEPQSAAPCTEVTVGHTRIQWQIPWFSMHPVQVTQRKVCSSVLGHERCEYKSQLSMNIMTHARKNIVSHFGKHNRRGLKIHTYISLTLYPRKVSRGILDILPRRPRFTKIT